MSTNGIITRSTGAPKPNKRLIAIYLRILLKSLEREQAVQKGRAN